MINYYQKQLRQYLSVKEIQELTKRIRNERKWNSRYFEDRYVERVLYNILQTYTKN